jgi:hypothetical protein
MMGQSFKGGLHVQNEEAMDLRADRLQALRSLAYLMRNDLASSERLESYLKLMDNVLLGMAADEQRWERASEPLHGMSGRPD